MDAKSQRIAKLEAENARLLEIIREQQRLIAQQADRIAQLEARIVRQEARIAQLEKNSNNSSKPPSSDIVKPPKPKPPRGKKRKRGGQPGHAKHERPQFTEDQIDERLDYELTDPEARGLRPLPGWHIVQQVTFSDKPLRIIEHCARRYLDPATGRIIISPLPPEVAQGGLLGADLSALVAYQKSACHMSYATIQQFWTDVFNLPLSRGYLVKVVQKASAALADPYTEAREAIARAERLGIDETGHKDNGDRYWTWCFRTDGLTVFHIDGSRGAQVLREVLGETFGGIIGCDYYSAYRAYMGSSGALVQFCLAHLIRDIRFLAEHGVPRAARWAEKLLASLKKLFDTLHRRSTLTEAGFARSMDRIRRAFLKTVRRPPSDAKARALAKRFRGGKARHYFTFLTTPNIEPTNNLTEQAIRHVVLDRRVTQGTRGDHGRRWCERAWTVVATCAQQGRSAFAFLYHAILAYFTGQPAPSLLPS